MHKFLVLSAILIPACTRTVLEVGDGTSQPWHGNEPNCPSGPPSSDACTVREGQSCGYWWQSDGSGRYEGCTCYEKDSSTKLWDCESASGPALDSCPTTPPAATDCSGHVGLTCPSPPRTECSCGVGNPDPVWSCTDRRTSVPGRPTSGPSSIPENKSIKDLSDDEASAWCNWYEHVYSPGGPSARTTPVNDDGLVTGLGSARGQKFYARACVPVQVPVPYCVANLKLAPCEATIGELSDCVLTLMNGSPSLHGCGRFLERNHCSETIVHRLEPQDGVTEAGAPDAGGSACDSVRVR